MTNGALCLRALALCASASAATVPVPADLTGGVFPGATGGAPAGRMGPVVTLRFPREIFNPDVGAPPFITPGGPLADSRQVQMATSGARLRSHAVIPANPLNFMNPGANSNRLQVVANGLGGAGAVAANSYILFLPVSAANAIASVTGPNGIEAFAGVGASTTGGSGEANIDFVKIPLNRLSTDSVTEFTDADLTRDKLRAGVDIALIGGDASLNTAIPAGAGGLAGSFASLPLAVIVIQDTIGGKTASEWILTDRAPDPRPFPIAAEATGTAQTVTAIKIRTDKQLVDDSPATAADTAALSATDFRVPIPGNPMQSLSAFLLALAHTGAAVTFNSATIDTADPASERTVITILLDNAGNLTQSGVNALRAGMISIAPANNLYSYAGQRAAGVTGYARQMVLPPPPQAPTLLAPPAGAAHLQDPITLSWSAVSGFTVRYTAVIATDPALTAVAYRSPSLAANSHTLPAGVLAPDTQFYWSVIANEDDPEAPPNAPLSFTTRQRGDCNGDGHVDFLDLNILLGEYGLAP